jgi:hypothetical protein
MSADRRGSAQNQIADIAPDRTTSPESGNPAGTDPSRSRAITAITRDSGDSPAELNC